MSDALLDISRLTLRFGGLTAVQDVDLRVDVAEVVAVIGPNGAGKTSLFNIISGIYAPTSGQLHFARRPLQRAFTWRSAVGWLAIGVLVGALLMLFVANIDRMWTVVVKRNYVYGHAFDGAQAFRSAMDYLDSDLRTRLLSFLLGLTAGVGGSYTVWQRSRRASTWIARQGIARTFQNNRLFANLSVLDNVMVALDRHHATWQHGAASDARAEALEWLTFVGLQARAADTAANLPYGDQRRLEIARALATRPQLLLLDEPAAGMNASETAALKLLIHAIRDKGIAILLIEHDMKLVMDVSDRVAVLEYGRKIADDTPDVVRADPRVIAAYLGAVDDAGGAH